MMAPVYNPPSSVDGDNIESFRRVVTQSAARYGHVVIDCSDVVRMGPSAMRVLVVAARGADVLLVNPNQMIRFMAAAYDVDISMSNAPEPDASHT
jgi:anti-anti-sigma regulatory factor